MVAPLVAGGRAPGVDARSLRIGGSTRLQPGVKFDQNRASAPVSLKWDVMANAASKDLVELRVNPNVSILVAHGAHRPAFGQLILALHELVLRRSHVG